MAVAPHVEDNQRQAIEETIEAELKLMARMLSFRRA